MQKRIETQEALVVQEKDQIGALRPSLEEEQAENAIAEKVDQCINRMYGSACDFTLSGRLTHDCSNYLEGNLQELREYVQRIESRRNTPRGFASWWKKEPMTLEDALGRILPIPLDIVVSWEVSFSL